MRNNSLTEKPEGQRWNVGIFNFTQRMLYFQFHASTICTISTACIYMYPLHVCTISTACIYMYVQYPLHVYTCMYNIHCMYIHVCTISTACIYMYVQYPLHVCTISTACIYMYVQYPLHVCTTCMYNIHCMYVQYPLHVYTCMYNIHYMYVLHVCTISTACMYNIHCMYVQYPLHMYNYTCFNERRKKERSKQGQTNNKAKQHSTPKAVTCTWCKFWISALNLLCLSFLSH